MSAEAAAGEPARERARAFTRRPRLSWIPRSVLLTLFGAALSAWLIPAFTRQWQDRQKERELKAALVTGIGNSASDVLVTSQYVAEQTFPNGGQAEYTRLSLDWARSTAEIDARLAAYFPQSRLVRRWREYSQAVQSTVFLLTIGRAHKAEAVKSIRAYIGPNVPVRWSLFLPVMHYPRAADEYVALSNLLLQRKEPLIRAVLDAHAEGFSTRGSDLVHDLIPFL